MHLDFAQPNILKISAAGDIMPADATGHAAVRYPDFGVEFAVNHGITGYMDFDTAAKRCAELQHAGGDGWVLAPDVRLLLLTIDYSRSGPAADPELFPDAESRWYWTAHACEWSIEDGAPRALWQVFGNGGGVGCVSRDASNGVVRPCRVVPRPGQ